MESEEEIARLTLVKNILNILCLLSGHLRIYPQGNEVVRVTFSRLMLQLDKYFVFDETLELVVARHGFIWNEHFVDRGNPLLQKFATAIFMHGVAVTTLHSGLSEYELMTFLRMVGREPAESWDEGGIRAVLELRRIDNIEIRELSEKDFRLREETGGVTSLASEVDHSDLWERFARGLFQRQHAGDGEKPPQGLEPSDLAAATSAFLAEAPSVTQQRFMGDVSAFLVSLQHENIRIYRSRALEKLTRYVNRLSPHLQSLFLKNLFTYNLKGEFAEEFFADLSDELIMAALASAAKGKSYVPPVVLDLLGKLARSREIVSADSRLPREEEGETLEVKARELFRSDDFEEYVPEKYRNALQHILRSKEIDGGEEEGLSLFKISLQEEKVEEHTARIIVHILSHEADECHLGGIFDHLDKIIDGYAESGNYFAIVDICALCLDQGGSVEGALRQILRSSLFVGRILDGVNRFGKEKFDALRGLIEVVGDPFVEPLLERLAEEKNRATRSFYIQCLKGLGPSVAERAGERFKDPRWYYLRNLLLLLREVGNPAQALLVRPLFLHPHPKVRNEAIRLGIFFRDQQAQRLLLEQLDAQDLATVTSAVAMARISRDPRIFAALEALLQRNEFLNYQLELKREVVSALLEVDQRQAQIILQRFLKSYNLIHPLHHAQLSREIAAILERGSGTVSGQREGRHE